MAGRCAPAAARSVLTDLQFGEECGVVAVKVMSGGKGKTAFFGGKSWDGWRWAVPHFFSPVSQFSNATACLYGSFVMFQMHADMRKECSYGSSSAARFTTILFSVSNHGDVRG